MQILLKHFAVRPEPFKTKTSMMDKGPILYLEF